MSCFNDDSRSGKQRIEYYDFLRGLAIIGVVALHVLDAFPRESDLLYLFLKNAVNCSVPLFLCVSGFFVSRYTFSEQGDYQRFVKRRMSRVLVPYLFWSIVFSAFAMVVYKKDTSLAVSHILLFKAQGPYYFIFLIIQGYALAPVLWKNSSVRCLLVSGVVSLVSCLLLLTYRLFSMRNPDIMLYAGPFSTWGVFFVLGYQYGRGYKISLSNASLSIGMSGALLLSLVESRLYLSSCYDIYISTSTIRISVFLYSFFVTVILLNNNGCVKSRAIAHVGRKSFGIFLVHLALLTMITRYAGMPAPTSSLELILVVVLIVGIVVNSCLIFISTVNHFVSARISRHLGFE